MPVDTHVDRVSKRLGLVGAKTPAARSHATLETAVGAGNVYQFHMDLIEHGRRVCKAQRPRCRACVLADICPSSHATAGTM